MAMNQSPIFIYGPPGAGKTSVGRALAQNLERDFIDLDALIEERAGQTIADIFASMGEASFRTLECDALLGILPARRTVIALGGGALLDPRLQSRVEQAGRVVFLDAPREALASRIAASGAERPVLQREGLDALLAQRADHYRGFSARVATAGKSSREVAERIQILIGQFLIAGAGMGKSEITIMPGISRDEPSLKAAIGDTSKCMVVSDSNVAPLYLATLRNTLEKMELEVASFVIPAGEASKQVRTLEGLWDALAAARLDRGSLIVSLGGGVVGDIAGLAAATYLRGIPWVNIPTSLLAMVDAGIGGKTGIDRPQAKNLVGAFHFPRTVVVDPDFLATLPETEIRNGLAELVKAAIIGNPDLFAACLLGVDALAGDWSNSIREAIAVKVKVVNQDPNEAGARAALNFGHTVGHAIEHVSNYAIAHGGAVAIGMAVESKIGFRAGVTSLETRDQILLALKALGLPGAPPPSIDPDSVWNTMQLDKKKADGQIRLALPRAIGKIETDVHFDNLRELFFETWTEINQ